jgi:hypothetical protein
MDIAAWVTLANGNGVSLPAARAQVVAGRLNRESGAVEPYEWPRPILAQCWPQGSTSDPVQQPRIESATPLTLQMRSARAEIMQDVPIAMAAMAAPQVVEEQLGDLKLYRVPDVTSVLSRQMKQVRLLDRRAVPVQFYYSAEVSAAHQSVPFAARMKLRTKNDSVHHLGLPLPSGSVDTFIGPHGTPLLLSESPLHDTALDEEVEIGLGDSPDVQVSSLPGAIEIDNARPVSIAIELRLALADGVELAHADQPVTRDRGAQLFKLTVPANGRAAIHYETTRTR